MLPGFLLLLIVLHVTKGCDLMNQKRKSFSADVGDPVLLPCSCSNLQNSPQKLIWRKYDSKNDWKILDPNQARFQLSNDQSPGNLSLLISAVEMEDEGLYRCETGDRYTDITLSVNGVGITAAPSLTSDTIYSLIPVVLLLLLLLGLAGVIVWRYKAKKQKQAASAEGPTGQEPQRNEQEPQRNEQEPQRNEQEPQRNEQERQDDVMYTTVTHNTTQQPKALSIDNRTEYASIRLN